MVLANVVTRQSFRLRNECDVTPFVAVFKSAPKLPMVGDPAYERENR
jgi:hypothetical protein